MTDREAFEAWISAPPFERNPERFPDDPTRYGWPGNYRELDIELAWCAWQDSRRAALTEAAHQCLKKRVDDAATGMATDRSYNLACNHCNEAIRNLRDRESGE